MKLPPFARDRRFVAGMILSISALLGLAVIRGSGGDSANTLRVLTLRQDLLGGQIIGPADVEEVIVSVPDRTQRQLIRATDKNTVVGRSVSRRLPAGHLLSAGDVVASGPAKVEVSIAATPGRVPSARIRPGDLVDVYVTSGPDDAPSAAVIARNLEVVAVSAQGSVLGGGASGPVSAITVTCPEDQVAKLVAATHARKVDVVRATGPRATGAADPRSTDPGATDPGATDPGATDPGVAGTAPASSTTSPVTAPARTSS